MRIDTGHTHPTGEGGDWGWRDGGEKEHALALTLGWRGGNGSWTTEGRRRATPGESAPVKLLAA